MPTPDDILITCPKFLNFIVGYIVLISIKWEKKFTLKLCKKFLVGISSIEPKVPSAALQIITSILFWESSKIWFAIVLVFSISFKSKW